MNLKSTVFAPADAPGLNHALHSCKLTRNWRSPSFSQNDRHPVVCVNGDDAKACASWLSRKTGKTYGLLSEAERGYVTRAGTTTPFWWGSSISRTQANYNGSLDPHKGRLKGGGWKGEFRGARCPSTASRPTLGTFTMHGNVWGGQKASGTTAMRATLAMAAQEPPAAEWLQMNAMSGARFPPEPARSRSRRRALSVQGRP